MNILHELNQLDRGGVERIVRNIIQFDAENFHTILAHKDGAFRKALEDAGANIVLAENDKEVDLKADVIHVHSGGGISKLIDDVGDVAPVIETIHSPVRSLIPDRFVNQRIGVTEVVTRKNHNCLTIHNGLDFNTLEYDSDPAKFKADLGINPDLPIIGRLGRLGKDKGLEDWLLTCFYLQQQGIAFTPLIVGPEARGINGYRGKLKLMAESLPVKGLKWVDGVDNVADYLEIMDIFLYPSPTEGFGLVFIEAIFCGSVVVSYKNDVTLETIGGYSILTEQSIPALVEGVKTALDPNVRCNIQGMAYEFVRSEYDAKRMAKDYYDLYKKIGKNGYKKA